MLDLPPHAPRPPPGPMQVTALLDGPHTWGGAPGSGASSQITEAWKHPQGSAQGKSVWTGTGKFPAAGKPLLPTSARQEPWTPRSRGGHHPCRLTCPVTLRRMQTQSSGHRPNRFLDPQAGCEPLLLREGERAPSGASQPHPPAGCGQLTEQALQTSPWVSRTPSRLWGAGPELVKSLRCLQKVGR